MLHDLDKSIAAFLRSELPSDLAGSIAITFETPDEHFPPSSVTGAAVNLFLVEVRENRELRDTEIRMVRQADGSILKEYPPVRVDCIYMVTAWAQAGATRAAEDEHRILGEVLRVLLRPSPLPDEALVGSLKGAMPPVRTRAMPAQPLPSSIELWHSLRGRVRASFLYVATVSMEVVSSQLAEAPVRGMSF